MQLYLIFSGISKIIRNYLLPDPFEMFEEQFLIELLGLEGIPIIIAFLTVGLVYESGSAPLLGSFLFFITNLFYGYVISTLASYGLPLWTVSVCPFVIYCLLLGLKQVLLEI